MDQKSVVADYVASGYDYQKLSTEYSDNMNNALEGKQVADLPVDKEHPYNENLAKLNCLFNLWKNNELPVDPKLKTEVKAREGSEVKPKVTKSEVLLGKKDPKEVPLVTEKDKKK